MSGTCSGLLHRPILEICLHFVQVAACRVQHGPFEERFGRLVAQGGLDFLQTLKGFREIAVTTGRTSSEQMHPDASRPGPNLEALVEMIAGLRAVIAIEGGLPGKPVIAGPEKRAGRRQHENKNCQGEK